MLLPHSPSPTPTPTIQQEIQSPAAPRAAESRRALPSRPAAVQAVEDRQASRRPHAHDHIRDPKQYGGIKIRTTLSGSCPQAVRSSVRNLAPIASAMGDHGLGLNPATDGVSGAWLRSPQAPPSLYPTSSSGSVSGRGQDHRGPRFPQLGARRWPLALGLSPFPSRCRNPSFTCTGV